MRPSLLARQDHHHHRHPSHDSAAAVHLKWHRDSAGGCGSAGGWADASPSPPPLCQCMITARARKLELRPGRLTDEPAHWQASGTTARKSAS
eukprot:1275152-Rhodomonas_salina.1